MYHMSFSQVLTQLQALLLKFTVLFEHGRARSRQAFAAHIGQLNQILALPPRMAHFPNSEHSLSHTQQLQLLLQQQIRLRETIQRIRRILDAQNVYRVAVQELMDFVKADWVFILEHGSGRLSSMAQACHPIIIDNTIAFNIYCELEAAATESGIPLPMAVNEQLLQQQPICQKWLSRYPGSWLLVPIHLLHAHQLQVHPADKPWGLLAIGCKDEAMRWSAVQQEQVQILVDEVAIALDQSLRYEQLKRDRHELQAWALTDSLTGLANRRQFDHYFDAEWQRLAREQQPLTLLLCDIDYFKRYNDYYGHPTGDICLAKVSDVLTSCIRRPADLVARYGGEEFAVVLPNTDTEGGHSVAQAIRRQLANVAIPHCASSVRPFVTLTMGVATIVPGRQRGSQDLLQAADLALYHAKQQGRDRIYVHAHYCVYGNAHLDKRGPKLTQSELGPLA
ncbi:GGDEF domain-containing protein [Leptothoe spongobia]|uniref:Diguanylate cyclase n=1 Tax=Leptothoe spongobia TAU-MAC 1115 TaxID=1967444 RepID=A0A947DBW9_9CYAN|nr:diguanylate cyclase [Leptothoe spongobia]MBT9314326.1 diguanylate cyclase [Leptothoe spongobia TAU-MAC 1115]